ncbi:MAG: CopD family protein, partial [Microvirga sp.]
FSDAIPFGLAALFGSGLALAGIQLGTLSALWTTPYGQVFLVKLGLLAALLGFALANRLRFTPSTLQGSASGRRHLAASIAAETVLAFGALGVAGLWRFTVPPRSAPADDASEAVIEMSSAEARARLTVRPARVGRVSLVVEQIEVLNGNTPPLEVTVTLEKPSFGIGPFRRAVPPSPAGPAAPLDFYLPMDGFWVLRLEILVDEFHKVSLTDIVSLSA